MTGRGTTGAEIPGQIVNDGLPLEYKLQDRRPSGNLHLTDVLNNPVGLGIVWISGYSLQEELVDFLELDPRPFVDQHGNPLLIR